MQREFRWYLRHTHLIVLHFSHCNPGFQGHGLVLQTRDCQARLLLLRASLAQHCAAASTLRCVERCLHLASVQQIFAWTDCHVPIIWLLMGIVIASKFVSANGSSTSGFSLPVRQTKRASIETPFIQKKKRCGRIHRFVFIFLEPIREVNLQDKRLI